jgi:hypothetical protein
LWSPVVKNQRAGAMYNPVEDVKHIVAAIKNEYGVVIEPVINEKFDERLKDLRKVAGNETKELDSSVLRFLQVEEHLAKHLRD